MDLCQCFMPHGQSAKGCLAMSAGNIKRQQTPAVLPARKIRTGILHYNREVVRRQICLLQADHMRVVAQRRQAEQLPAMYRFSTSQVELVDKSSKHDYA